MAGQIGNGGLSILGAAPYRNMSKMRKPMIIAHRGASALAGENTIESFEKAIGIGTDMIEFDVRRTKDHVLVAHHDRFIHETLIRDLTYREIENSFPSKTSHVATIEEIVKFAKGKTRMDAHVKEEGYENEVIQHLARDLEEDEFVVTSFNDSSLKTIKSNYPSVKAGLILGRPKPKEYIRTRISELFPMRRCGNAKADFLVPHLKLMRFGFLKRAEKNHKPVYVWTVNDERMIERFLKENRVQGIITDLPELAVKVRNRIFPTEYTF